MLFKFKHADKIVGLFVIIAIVSFCLVLLVIGINKQWFTTSHPFQSRFPSAAGISKGMPISMSGFEIGKVTSLTLNINNKVDITFVVYDKYIDKIKPNTVLELAVSPIGLGGGMILYPGKNDSERLPDNTFIPSSQSEEGRRLIKAGLVDKPVTSDTISELIMNINTLSMSINTLVNDIDGAITGASDTPLANALRNLDSTLKNVDDMTADLAVLTDRLQSPEGLVPTLLASPGSSIDTFFHDDNRLYDRIYSAVGGLDDSIGNISNMTADLSGLTPELSLMLEQLNATMDGAQKVMEGLQNNPLLKQGISKEKEAEKSKSDIRDENF
jgi:phospholipid/cholesterol/gamma-HCH transport system substrate-binding protein